MGFFRSSYRCIHKRKIVESQSESSGFFYNNFFSALSEMYEKTYFSFYFVTKEFIGD
ncbi:hypothetical protein FLAN108750_04875 [Flavobacterium antarcticum]